MDLRLDGVRLGETPAGLAALGLTVVDDIAVVGGVRLHAVGDEGHRGLLGLDLADAAPDGPLPLVTVPPAASAGAEHPLGATAVDHVVVLCGDLDATLAALGASPRSIDERDGRRYAFVLAGTALLEFVGPSRPDDRAARLWGLALTVQDLDAAVALLGDAVGAPKDAVQPGRRIATVRHHRLGLATPTVLLTPRR